MIPPNSPYAKEGTARASGALPQQLSFFVERHRGVEAALVFTSDSLLRSFSSNLALEEAERVSAVAGQLFALAGNFAELTERGAAEQVIVRMGTGFLLVSQATPATGLALLTSRNAPLDQIAGEAVRLVESLRSALPQTLSTQIGAPLLAGAAV
ncbi:MULTISPECIES: roadblock/LC7 domain-containing protein [unclassified Nocardiopsis]|uniref:roadblock/LC7 domain-containing protein n=1 Tax=unclassified Nocardiopsis TaxID=2649073 RepID=UPI001357CC00|nr:MULTISPECIES: roadblock/LC7 domain-containing protein [unclassified Nocardiopsis]